MGLTAHLAVAFEAAEAPTVIAMLSGKDGAAAEAAIAYQPKFGLTREDHYPIHRVLEALAEGNPALMALGTIVQGAQAVSEAGMGTQYFFPADAVRAMAVAYGEVTPGDLAAAIERVQPEFDSHAFAPMREAIVERFEAIRVELGHVADGGWAMVAGMW